MSWPVLCAFAAEPIYLLPRVNLRWILPVSGFNSSAVSSCGHCHVPCFPITREAAATRTKVLCANSSAGRWAGGLLCLILSQNHLIPRGGNFLSRLRFASSPQWSWGTSRKQMMQLMLILAPELLHRVNLFHSVAYALWYCQGKTHVSQLKAVILSQP